MPAEPVVVAKVLQYNASFHEVINFSAGDFLRLFYCRDSLSMQFFTLFKLIIFTVIKLFMEASLKYKVKEIFSRYHFSQEDADFITEVLSEIDERQDEKFQLSKELFLTQKDKVELIDRIQSVEKTLTDKIQSVEQTLTDRIQSVEQSLTNRIHLAEKSFTKTVYLIGLVQFLAIVVSVLAIINFMIR